MKKVVTNSAKETHDFAKNYAKSFKGGEIITLQGDLGAGKTVFAKGLAAGLGVKRMVTSPTFVVMKKYKTLPVGMAGIKELVHVDAYRLSSGSELEAIGIEEYFERNDCITVIEWPEKVKSVLPKARKISFKIKNDTRLITIN